MAAELDATLTAWAARADRVLAARLPGADIEPRELHEAMRYAVLSGGKRIRPMLVYAACDALGGASAAADASAAAVEIIHAYSLVHDDLPAMDDDDLRRGLPTCHVRYGDATAILAGDALQALAFAILAEDTLAATAPTRLLEMVRVLAAACGSSGMAGGQALDLAAVGRRLDADELERMHVHKTGALIRASVRLGALAAGLDDPARLDALERYGHAVGLAFQIRDDILDIEGETTVIGKQQGADLAREKPTYPSIHGLDAARALAEAQRRAAHAALGDAGLSGGGLAALADYAVDRVS
jgi:geranylgeranyl pyrophosphate synthase